MSKNLKHILSVIILFLICSILFGNYIKFDNTQTLFIVSILSYISSLLTGFFVIGILILLLPLLNVTPKAFTGIMAIILSFLIFPLSLYLFSYYLPGFEVKGVIPYVIISIALYALNKRSLIFKKNA